MVQMLPFAAAAISPHTKVVTSDLGDRRTRARATRSLFPSLRQASASVLQRCARHPAFRSPTASPGLRECRSRPERPRAAQRSTRAGLGGAKRPGDAPRPNAREVGSGRSSTSKSLFSASKQVVFWIIFDIKHLENPAFRKGLATPLKTLRSRRQPATIGAPNPSRMKPPIPRPTPSRVRGAPRARTRALGGYGGVLL